MKPILHLLFFIFFFVELNNEIVAQNTNAYTTLKTKLILANDSGFVTKEIGRDFLLANSLDKINYFYENEKWNTKDKNKLKKLCL